MNRIRACYTLAIVFALNFASIASAQTPLAPSTKIPSIPGLVVSKAQSGELYQGKPVDTEMIIAITAVDGTSQHLSVHFSFFSKTHRAAPLGEHWYKRQNLIEDLKTSQRFGDMYYSDPDPKAGINVGGPLVVAGDPMSENSPGMTYDVASARVLEKLKTRGKSLFLLLTSQADEMQPMNIVSDQMFDRIGTADEMLPVLVNGKSMLLPAVHARGHVTHDGKTSDIDLWFLDDSENVLLLKSIALDAGDPIPATTQVVRIDYPLADAQAATMLSQSLSAGACRAELHGVYFNSASANLLPESDPTLRQVASVLKQHGDWTLAIEGHTDNQGAVAYNLDLSKRRAAAVRDALVKRLGVPAKQLSVAGFGETKPVDSNDTLIGRAHNRRVELSRACGKP